MAETLEEFIARWPYEEEIEGAMDSNDYENKDKLLSKYITCNFTRDRIPPILHSNIEFHGML